MFTAIHSAPAPAPSPLDTLHLSLSAALPRLRRRNSLSPTSSAFPQPNAHARVHATDAHSIPRPRTPQRTFSTPILPHARATSDSGLYTARPPSARLYAQHQHPYAATGPSTSTGLPLRPIPRLHPLAMAHISRIAESAELLMQHLQATLLRKAGNGTNTPRESGALQLDLGRPRPRPASAGPAGSDELVEISLSRAALLKSLASFRANVNNIKRERHHLHGHAVGPKRVFGQKGAGAGRGAGTDTGTVGAYRPRRGAVVSLNGMERRAPGAGAAGWDGQYHFGHAYVQEVQEQADGPDEAGSEMEMEMDVEREIDALEERFEHVRLQ